MRWIKPFLNVFIIIFLIYSCAPTRSLKVPNRQLKQIGSEGSSEGKFREPRGLSFTPEGNLLIVDFRNYRVQELSPQGQFLHQWGTKGNQPGQFNDPTCAVMTQTGELFVVDSWNHRIQKLDKTGEWITPWTQDDGFYAPRGITLDDKGRVYISNTSFHQIKVYDLSGHPLFSWGTGSASEATFHDPVGLAFDSLNHLIYVADTGNQRIKVLNLNGETIRLISVPDWEKDKFHEAYLAVDKAGKVYATVPHKNLVLVFSPEGRLFSRFGEPGAGPEQLNYPTGIAVDDSNKIYISDTLNHRIVVYAPAPPLPIESHEETTLLSQIFSYCRYCIDIFALIIIIKWYIRKKYFKQKKKHVATCLTTYYEWCRNHPKTLTFVWLIITFIHLLALHFFADYQLHQACFLLLTFSIFWLLYEFSRKYEDVIDHSAQQIPRYIVALSMILILALSVWIRIYKIKEIPLGLNNDAAWNGMYAMRILDGEPYTPFTSEAWGKSTFYFYCIAFIFKLFGEGRFTLLIPCILAGVIAVPLVFLLVRHLLNLKTALISSFVYSILAWNIVFSRTGYRVILAPVFFLSTFLFFFKAIEEKEWKKKLGYFLLSGLAVGIGQHTYFSFRGIPLMMIFIGLYLWIREKEFFRANWWGFITLLLAFFAVFSPLVIYAIHNWNAFMERSDFLFIGRKIKESGSLWPLWHNIKTNFLIFHYKARVGNFFNNEWPIISRPVAFFSMIGFLFFLRHLRKKAGFFFILSFIFGMLPGILSEADAARTFMTTISIAVFCAVGIQSFFLISSGSFSKKRLIPIVLSCILIGTAEFNFYFHRSATDYYAQFGYARKHTLIGLKARELSSDYEVYVSQGHFIDTPKFICYRIPWNVFSITDGEVIDAVPIPRLLENLNKIFNAPRVPGKMGLAFVIENDPKNVHIINEIKNKFPAAAFKAYSDSHYSDPIYYVIKIPNTSLHSNNSPS